MIIGVLARDFLVLAMWRPGNIYRDPVCLGQVETAAFKLLIKIMLQSRLDNG